MTVSFLILGVLYTLKGKQERGREREAERKRETKRRKGKEEERRKVKILYKDERRRDVVYTKLIPCTSSLIEKK